MAQMKAVEGFEAFVKETEALKSSGKPIIVLFSGSKDTNGKSWCPDCVAAEPVVKKALADAPADTQFLYVGVGGRDFWKDPNCVFRTDARTKLKSVPTLMIYGGPQRLEEGDCSKPELVQMLFGDAE